MVVEWSEKTHNHLRNDAWIVVILVVHHLEKWTGTRKVAVGTKVNEDLCRSRGMFWIYCQQFAIENGNL